MKTIPIRSYQFVHPEQFKTLPNENPLQWLERGVPPSPPHGAGLLISRAEWSVLPDGFFGRPPMAP